VRGRERCVTRAESVSTGVEKVAALSDEARVALCVALAVVVTQGQAAGIEPAKEEVGGRRGQSADARLVGPRKVFHQPIALPVELDRLSLA